MEDTERQMQNRSTNAAHPQLITFPSPYGITSPASQRTKGGGGGGDRLPLEQNVIIDIAPERPPMLPTRISSRGIVQAQQQSILEKNPAAYSDQVAEAAARAEDDLSSNSTTIAEPTRPPPLQEDYDALRAEVMQLRQLRERVEALEGTSGSTDERPPAYDAPRRPL